MKCRATQKVQHANMGAAIAAAKRMKNAGLDVYRCQHCACWHLGSTRNPVKQQARIDQLLRGQA